MSKEGDGAQTTSKGRLSGRHSDDDASWHGCHCKRSGADRYERIARGGDCRRDYGPPRRAAEDRRQRRNTRASGTPGYDASVNYIANLLLAAGYEVTQQNFLFNSFRELSDPVFEQLAPNEVTYEPNVDFFTAEYSGSGEVEAPLQAVDLVLPPGEEASTSNSGCEVEDFADFVAGNIALVQRGTCDFSVKAHNAFAGRGGWGHHLQRRPGGAHRNPRRDAGRRLLRSPSGHRDLVRDR